MSCQGLYSFSRDSFSGIRHCFFRSTFGGLKNINDVEFVTKAGLEIPGPVTISMQNFFF